MKAVDLLRTIKSHIFEGDLYLKKLDNNLQTYLTENEYSTTQCRIYETLIEFEFGPDAEMVFEWLYNTFNEEVYNLTAQQLVDKLSTEWKITNEKCGG